MMPWLRGWVLKVLRNAQGFCGPHGQQPPLPDPQKIVATWEAISLGRQPVPEYFNFAHDVLDMWSQLEKAGHRPQIPAFWWVNGKGTEVKWNFEELGEQSRNVANVLQDMCGLQPGDRMMLVLPRLPEWWLVSMACIRTGAVMIPGVSQLTEKDLRYRLQASRAKSIITSDSLAPQVDAISADYCPSLQSKLLVSDGSRPGWMNFRELLHEASTEHNCVRTKSQDPLAIYFTSGTTGAPKMVEHSQASYGLGFLASGRRWVDLTKLDIFWNTSDTGWVKAAWTLFSAWSNGSCIFVHELPPVDAKIILNVLSSYPINSMVGAPIVYRMLVQQDLSRYQFQSLRHCLTGGEALNPDVREKWKSQVGLELHEGYGQSKTVLICANSKGMKIKSGSMGKASPLYDVQIMDDEGNILSPGEEGNIAVQVRPTRPFCFFSCYLNNPQKTEASERGDFHIMGDRAHKDKDGYFWFTGINDDVINSSSYRIGPVEVENALAEHPVVLEAAVVSSPDPIRGEVVKAFIVLSPAYSSQDPKKLTQELQEHVKRVTAPYKYPRKVAFVSELPKTVSGKIQRNKLRSQEWGELRGNPQKAR
ncbi:LOW QUALITY PROTEIN: acyl-coenzyme A synthetase ACSM5, mitochondrial [Neomonachus schauinslandi]|uniref:medium-chain acyl-CoA ligase n=1 Tax=Neomonachus schauinslandi TaxID=29088 RepID=A0A8M1MAX2_NEOSC|nr:LOW QUALITY PROTEIN: acyl-coenzyme A synthetase ACSM5, mitochondrial [Neomonachus schauinslandi]